MTIQRFSKSIPLTSPPSNIVGLISRTKALAQIVRRSTVRILEKSKMARTILNDQLSLICFNEFFDELLADPAIMKIGASTS